MEHSLKVNNHISVLDGFRGLAILLVMFYHFQEHLRFGWIGVDLFFILSGFLITGKLVESLSIKQYYFSFYRKRALRILPLYYLVLLFFFLVLPVAAPGMITSSFQNLADIQLLHWFLLHNFWEAVNGFPENITLVHFWSLAVEMQFYLLWPFIVKGFYKKKGNIFLFLMLLLISGALLFRIWAPAVLHMDNVSRYVLLPSRMDAFATGAVLYILVQRYAGVMRKISPFILLTGISAILVFSGMNNLRWYFGEEFVWTFGFTFNLIFWFGLMGTALLQSNVLNRIFSYRWLREAGKYSYGMYIFHLPVYILASRLFSSEIIQAIFALCATVIVGVFSYHFFEKYFLRARLGLQHAKA